MRPSFDEYFATIAKAVSLRADCTRAQHGAVIVKNSRIVSTGYNGTPSGSVISCAAGDCPRAESNVAHCEGDYDRCISVHAEANAIVYANRADTDGATIYVTGPACRGCQKLIAAAGIVRTVF